MFKIPLLNRHKIVSDEGFTVTFVSRNVLMYEEDGISLLIDVDGDGKQMDVISSSLRPVTLGKKLPDDLGVRKIEGSIARALEWRGWSVDIA